MTVRTIEDTYIYYKQTNPTSPIDKTSFRKIINGFVKFIMMKVFSGFDVELSTNKSLGIIGIRGKKLKPLINEENHIKRAVIDWGGSKKMWVEQAKKMGISYDEYMKTVKGKPRLYHLNEHTDGLSYSFKWMKKDTKLHNKDFYMIAFSRANRRTLPALLRKGAEYLVIR